MASKNNPAGRLYELLAPEIDLQRGDPAKEVWSEILGSDGDTEFLWLFGQVCDLPRQIRLEVYKRDGGENELLIRHLHRFEEALLFPLSNPWKQLSGHIDGAPMYRLEFCSQFLDDQPGYPELAKDKIGELRNQLTDLRKSVVNSDLDGDLRDSLLWHIDRMRSALSEYRVLGVDSVREAAEATIGDAFLRYRTVEETASEGGKVTFRKVAAFAGVLLATVSTVKASLEVGEMLHPGLLPPPTEQHPIDPDDEP